MTLNMIRTYRKAPMTARLVRTFVPTGEGRCRLASVWTLVEETMTSTEEPSLSRPAWRTLLSFRRAFYLPGMRFA